MERWLRATGAAALPAAGADVPNNGTAAIAATEGIVATRAMPVADDGARRMPPLANQPLTTQAMATTSPTSITLGIQAARCTADGMRRESTGMFMVGA